MSESSQLNESQSSDIPDFDDFHLQSRSPSPLKQMRKNSSLDDFHLQSRSPSPSKQRRKTSSIPSTSANRFLFQQETEDSTMDFDVEEVAF